MRKEVDFLVIGSGIAGLSFALKTARHGKVCLVTKTRAEESSTKYAQGGIAAVMYTPDTYEKHIRDTIDAGAGLNNKTIVEITIRESTERIRELIEWGTRFDKNPKGEYDLGREGGHSEHRVLHHKDSTGLEIERALLQQAHNHPNIELLEDHFAIDLITQHHLGEEISRHSGEVHCFGAYVLDSTQHSIITILAKNTLIATGGSGNIYQTTTNPPVATGDGIAMVYRAKGSCENMEFMQFHPTSLFNPGEKPSFLITEALRGFGGILKTCEGVAFMEKYDVRGSLAPRDIVARAIDTEMKISGDDHVCLDCTHLNPTALRQHFPNIWEKCHQLGLDLSIDTIPVVPAAHYMCGGIKVDEWARSSIKNLYATGECASTGLHGANRLASNSLLEALVFSHRAANHAIDRVKEIDINHHIPDWNDEGTVMNEEMVLITQSIRELQGIMSHYVGIVRSDLRLKRAIDRLETIYQETEELYQKSILNIKICELRNMINVAYLVIKMATKRRESIGLHYSIDYPNRSEQSTTPD